MPGPSARPDLGKRVIAYIIDVVITSVVMFVPVVGVVTATVYWLVRDGLDFDFMNHRSIGKMVMKLRPVMLDGQPLDIAASIKRNWMFGALVLLPVALVFIIVELALVLTDAEGRRMGDRMAGTRVIEIED